ncbi:CobW family GTP-binding protein [Paenibacillus xanthanilyticus]|uniref:CobW family GTP-binding protein n=1 Tax=Paenibacillus xanthanilyticus TaxID=1783531 RepID=A0ABV8K483_9BACL
MMETRPIPVVVVSGFLGSGKTTMLLRVLQHAKAEGMRASVLMNEVGSVDVDGIMVSGQAAASMLERVTEGCLCCSKKSELSQCLERLAEAAPDVIFIELTGVANPEEIVEAMSEPQLAAQVALHRIVTVLDAEHAIDYNSIFSTDRELVHTLRRQIEVADLVLANKADLISSKTAAKLDKMVRDRNAACQLVLTVRGDVKPSLILDGIEKSPLAKPKPSFGSVRVGGVPISPSPGTRVFASPPQPASVSASQPFSALQVITKQRQSYSRVKSITLYPGTASAVTKRSFEAFFAGRGNGCLRAKGFMPLGPGGSMLLFQLAGKRVEWQKADYAGEPYFVIIGIDLDHARISAEWEKLTKH